MMAPDDQSQFYAFQFCTAAVAKVEELHHKYVYTERYGEGRTVLIGRYVGTLDALMSSWAHTVKTDNWVKMKGQTYYTEH